jgi:hypothetical protein
MEMRATADGLNTPFPHAFSTSREPGKFYIDDGKLIQPLIPGIRRLGGGGLFRLRAPDWQ